MEDKRFWTAAYDEGVTDMDPALWDTNYLELVKPTFEKFPDRAALSFMGTEITYREFDRYANRFANMLLSHGIRKGDVVAINLPNIPQYLIAWLGAMKAGAVISGMSPLLSPNEMDYQLKDSDARVLVTLDDIYTGKLVEVVPKAAKLGLVVVASIGEFMPGAEGQKGKGLSKEVARLLEGEDARVFPEVIAEGNFSDEPPQVELAPDDIAYIQYTGGTTGPPKGAMLSHRGCISSVIAITKWMGWEHGAGVSLSGAPFFHIAGLYYEKYCMYLGWTQIIILDPRDTDHICNVVEKYRPVVIGNVPSLYQLLMANPRFRELDHSSLEACMSGAAPFPEESQRELEAIIGKGKLLEVYGMTETSPLISSNPARGKKKLGTIGLPLMNTDIKLVDHATGQVVPQGEPGEICVKGPQVMAGYYKKDEETRAAIDEQGYLHTGDVAIQDEEGYLRIVDRTKDMIIVGGFKVFSKKVEEILTEHPAIGMIATIGLPNPKRPGSEIVKAVIQLAEGYVSDLGSDLESELDEEALKADITDFAKKKVAPYEVPKVIEFTKELPLTSVGKIDKKELRKD